MTQLPVLTSPPEILLLIPDELAYRYGVFPLGLKDDQLRVAISNPHDLNKLNDLRFILNRNIIPEEYPQPVIQKAIKKHYKHSSSVINGNSLNGNKITEFQVVEKKDEKIDVKKLRQEIDQVSVIQLVNRIITDAITQHASDIHIEPYEKEFRVRFRIDGVLQEVNELPLAKKNAIISRLKIMADLDIAEKRRPQDGRIRVTDKQKIIDIRVSTLPTDFGEKVVLRILDKDALSLDLQQIGFETKELNQFKKAISAPFGMILVTGPTGSGKTTTLYAALNYLNTPERNILTIEDPIEYNLPGINQSHMRSDIGFTFAKALRAFLRQDPNVIMVGEIRDLETAEIAIRAALTGHLVLSTLHTNDAPTTISRLIDMGLEPFLISSSVRLVMAQRLVRKICPECKQEIKIADSQLNELLHNDSNPESPIKISVVKFFQGDGCDFCNNTGYKGRIALFEVMPITPTITDMILKNATAYELRQQAVADGMFTLRQSGIEKIKQGITTVDEVLRETMV